MTSLPANDSVPAAAQRLRGTLKVPGLAQAVADYFCPTDAFAGMTFSDLGRNPRDQVIPDDLLAVSLLDIAWRPDAVRQLLDIDSATVSRLLAAVRDDVDLWEVSDEDLDAVDPLWDMLTAIPGVGTATRPPRPSCWPARGRACAPSATRS